MILCWVTCFGGFAVSGQIPGLRSEGFLAVDNGFDFSFAVNEAGQPGSYFPPYKNPNWPVTNVPDLEGDPEGTYLTDRLPEAAVSFIKEPRDTPFLLVLSHYSVHTPLQAPDSFVERYVEKAALLGPDDDANYRAEQWGDTKLRQDHPTYAAMVESIDRSVGRVLSALEESGMDEETIVVFTSDNGGVSFRRKVGTVRPDHCARLIIDPDLAEILRVLQRLKDRPPELGEDVHLLFDSVIELELQAVVCRRLSEGDVQQGVVGTFHLLERLDLI